MTAALKVTRIFQHTYSHEDATCIVRFIQDSKQETIREMKRSFLTKDDKTDILNKIESGRRQDQATFFKSMEDLGHRIEKRIEKSEEKSEARANRMEDKFEARTRGMEERFEERSKGIEEKIETTSKSMEEKFDARTRGMEEKFEERSKGIEKKIEATSKSMEEKFDARTRGMEEKFEVRFNYLGERLNRVEDWLGGLEIKFDALRDMFRRLESQYKDDKIDIFNRLDSHFKWLMGVIIALFGLMLSMMLKQL